jgi:hypothetical protein
MPEFGGPGNDFGYLPEENAHVGPGAGDDLRARLSNSLFRWVDPTTIPLRRWIMYPDYVGGHISILAAKGGVGKSSLAIVEALSIATGRNLLHPNDSRRQPRQSRAMIVNLEDDLDEMNRRIMAAMKHYGLAQEDIGDRLCMAAGRDIPLVLGRLPDRADMSRVDHRVRTDLTAVLRELNISVLVVDPFILTHRLQENDNSMQAELLNAWGLIASDTKAAILLVHHSRKLNGEEATDDSIRGASAMLAAARSARMINPMSADQAIRLNIPDEDRRRCFRVDNAKHNLARPPNEAEWHQLVEVSLENDPEHRNHDHVGVVATFFLPDPAAGVTNELAQQVHDYLVQNGPQRASSKSPQWFGWKVAGLMGLGWWPAGPARSSDDGKRVSHRATTALALLATRGVIRAGEERVGRKTRPVWCAGGDHPGGASQNGDQPEIPF